MKQDQNTELLALANQLADAARVETLRYFRGGALVTTSKGDENYFDPVTVADRAAEAAMREIITKERPLDGVLGEEFPPISSQNGLTWVLDPIDGTRGYISGTPTWGTLIALHNGAEPVLGVIDQPYIGERFSGGFGQAKMTGPHGGRELSVSITRALKDAIVFTTYPEVGTPDQARAFHNVAKTCKMTRYGMDCYAYALLASGQIDLVIEAGLQAYDIQAPIAVIEAAGGVVSDWQGKPADQGGTALAAATPELHAKALEILMSNG